MLKTINIIVQHNCEKCGNPEIMYWCNACERNEEDDVCNECGKTILIDKEYHEDCTIENEDKRTCYLCDSILVNKWCENTSCTEYRKHEEELSIEEISYNDIKEHVGHDIACLISSNRINVAIECKRCLKILISRDK